MAYIIDIYPAEVVASGKQSLHSSIQKSYKKCLDLAIAANGVSRYTLGAVFPLFTLQMYEKLGTTWASCLFAIISCVLVSFCYSSASTVPGLGRQ
jgi:hypothetical protein